MREKNEIFRIFQKTDHFFFFYKMDFMKWHDEYNRLMSIVKDMCVLNGQDSKEAQDAIWQMFVISVRITNVKVASTT